MGAYIGWPAKVLGAECWSTHHFTARWCVVPCSLTGKHFLCPGTFGHSGRPGLMKPYLQMPKVQWRKEHLTTGKVGHGCLFRMPLADWRGVGNVSWSMWIVSNVPNVVASSVVLHNVQNVWWPMIMSGFIIRNHLWCKSPTTPMQVQVQLSFAMPSKTSLISETTLYSNCMCIFLSCLLSSNSASYFLLFSFHFCCLSSAHFSISAITSSVSDPLFASANLAGLFLVALLRGVLAFFDLWMAVNKH